MINKIGPDYMSILINHVNPVLIQIEVVLQLHKYRYRASTFHRGNELDFACSSDGSFRQSERQRTYGAYLHDFARARKDDAEHDSASDLISARFFSVFWFGFEQETCSLFDLRSGEGSVQVVRATT